MKRLWNAYRRWIDCLILWPVCKREAAKHADEELSMLDIARGSFMVHTTIDPAWRDLTHEETIALVGRLA
jgi:hypothetical protein